MDDQLYLVEATIVEGLPGSPAVDAGETVCTDANGVPLTTDQRGLPRPVDGNNDGIVNCDIGAVELQP